MARKSNKVTKETINTRIAFIESQLRHLKLDLQEYYADEEARVAHQRVVATATRGGQTTEEIVIDDEVIVTNPNGNQEREGVVVDYNPDSGFAFIKGKQRGGIIRRYIKNLRKK